MRRIAMLATLVLVMTIGLSAMSMSAHATQPLRERLDNPDEVILGDCGFDILFEEVADKEYLTTYFDREGNVQRQVITGVLKYNATNMETGETLFLNISGWGTYTYPEDGSVHLVGAGKWLHFGVVNRPGEILLTSGHFEGDYGPDGFVFTDPASQESSLCDLLG